MVWINNALYASCNAAVRPVPSTAQACVVQMQVDMQGLRALGPSITCACQSRPYTPVGVSVVDRLPLYADIGSVGLLFKFGSGKASKPIRPY